jgi:hypothetical protein
VFVHHRQQIRRRLQCVHAHKAAGTFFFFFFFFFQRRPLTHSFILPLATAANDCIIELPAARASAFTEAGGACPCLVITHMDMRRRR